MNTDRNISLANDLYDNKMLGTTLLVVLVTSIACIDLDVFSKFHDKNSISHPDKFLQITCY